MNDKLSGKNERIKTTKSVMVSGFGYFRRLVIPVSFRPRTTFLAYFLAKKYKNYTD